MPSVITCLIHDDEMHTSALSSCTLLIERERERERQRERERERKRENAYTAYTFIHLLTSL